MDRDTEKKYHTKWETVIVDFNRLEARKKDGDFIRDKDGKPYDKCSVRLKPVDGDANDVFEFQAFGWSATNILKSHPGDLAIITFMPDQWASREGKTYTTLQIKTADIQSFQHPGPDNPVPPPEKSVLPKKPELPPGGLQESEMPF